MIENAEELIRELKHVIELYKDEKLFTFEVSRKRMAEDCIRVVEKLKAENDRLYEYVDNLEEQQKDLCGELELWQRENAELKLTISKMETVKN